LTYRNITPGGVELQCYPCRLGKNGLLVDMSEPAGFTYAIIETALARIFDVDAVGQKTWLRARIQHLRRLGLVAESPGKGRTIIYKHEHADRWLLALLLTLRLGRDPAKTVEFLQTKWDRPTARRSRRHQTDRSDWLLADIVEEARKVERREDHIIITFDYSEPKPSIGHTTIRGMTGLGYDLGRKAGRMVVVLDLTVALAEFDAALAAAGAPKPVLPPEPTGLAAKILAADRRRRGEE
jgi:hypothetical protein